MNAQIYISPSINANSGHFRLAVTQANKLWKRRIEWHVQEMADTSVTQVYLCKLTNEALAYIRGYLSGILRYEPVVEILDKYNQPISIS